MDELKDGIADYVVDSFHTAQDKLLRQNTGSSIKTMHVSDLVSPCLRKSYYQRLYPMYEMTDDMRSILFHGTVVHEHSKLAPFHEITMCYDVTKDLAYPPEDVKQMDDKQREGIISGTVDDVVKYGDHYVICDKKTYNSKGYTKKEVDPSHALQVNIYNVLLTEAYNITAKYGCVLYLDKMKDLKELPMVFELDPLDEVKEFMRSAYNKLSDVRPPEGEICFLCNGKNKLGKIYCNYLDQCVKDGNRFNKK